MARTSKRAKWLTGFYAQECCGQPMSSGYDVMTFECSHTDYATVTENAYYALCSGQCGDGEILCSKCVDEAVIDANS